MFAGMRRIFKTVRPEISIIPVGKTKAGGRITTPIRLVTKEEAVKVENCFKRKSLPLEKCPVCKKFFRRMKTHLQVRELIVKFS